jgi:cysteine desulfuration protein SufE
MAQTIDDIIADFDFLDDWEDRYRYVIDLGRDLKPYPESARDALHRVKGCVSQVWLKSTLSDDADPVIDYVGDSDAHIVRGLVAIMMVLYSGKNASEILAVNPEAVLKKLGLDEHLTPQRSNGLRAMIGRIRSEAQAVLATAEATQH